ncbi:hypothetical protein D3C87_1861590 [compost metagenome]
MHVGKQSGFARTVTENVLKELTDSFQRKELILVKVTHHGSPAFSILGVSFNVDRKGCFGCRMAVRATLLLCTVFRYA